MTGEVDEAEGDPQLARHLVVYYSQCNGDTTLVVQDLERGYSLWYARYQRLAVTNTGFVTEDNF